MQNNNFARAPRIFAHFFTVLARLRRENANCKFYGEPKQATTNFFFAL